MPRLCTFVVMAPLLGGCAHTAKSSETPDSGPATADPTARLSRDNAALRRRVQMLEDRVLHLEQAGGGSVAGGPPAHDGGPARTTTATVDLPDGRAVPVVRLAPPGAAEPSADRPPPSTSTSAQAPTHTTASAPRSAASRGASMPTDPRSTGSAAARGGGHDGRAMRADASAAARPSAPVPEEPRSFRLLGSQLVEATRSGGTEGTDEERAKHPQSRRGRRRVIARYDDAMARLKSGDPASAEVEFDAIAREHPRHDYADNALYWKGEAAYDQDHFSDALAAFTAVVERYGGGNKAPDALLKIGLCYHNLGDAANARDVLTELIAAYPGARASDIARVKLAELGS